MTVKFAWLSVLCGLLVGMGVVPQAEGARLKDISQFRGVRDNQLVGYGLVIGLQQSGDSNRSIITGHSLAAMLAGMGVNIDPDDVRVRNVAAVMVTANLPPFARSGSRLDVTVSSIGDAKSMEGGTLLMTPLKAPNGQVFAVAQGALTVGGFNVEAAGSRSQKNYSNVARIPRGALVEREVAFTLDGQETLELALKSPDFTTATRAATAINDTLGEPLAKAADSGTVVIEVSEQWKSRIPELIATIEVADVAVDVSARVILNERTGTIVMGENVRIDKVAIAHGNLTIQIQTSNEVSQPQAFSEGTTAEVQNATIQTAEENNALSVVEGATIGEVVGALNTLGVSPRDLITILQAMQAAGALQADINVL